MRHIDIVATKMYVISLINYADLLTVDELSTVLNETWEARSKWKNLGLQLGLNINDLDAIYAGNRSIDDYFTDTITLWLRQTDLLPTWTNLVLALEGPTIGFQTLAHRIQMKYIVERKSDDVIPLTFPHINEIAPDEDSRQLLEGRLRAQTKEIIHKYRVLKHKHFDKLEDRNYPVERLARYLKDYGGLNLTSIKNVQEFITDRSSFYDYHILKYIILLAGDEEDKQNLEEYERHFRVYARRRIFECPSNIGFIPASKSHSLLCVKLDSIYDKCTADELVEFQQRLCDALDMSIYVCKLNTIERGCIKLTFIIHNVSKPTFPLSTKQETELVELGVCQLEYRDYRFEGGFSQTWSIRYTIVIGYI